MNTRLPDADRIAINRVFEPCDRLGAVDPEPLQVVRQLPSGAGLVLHGEIAGEGLPVVLLHGLSATRRNVVQGSRALLRRGYRLIAYDARGHGASSPAPTYTYPDLVEDLKSVLADLALERVAVVGSSMGAATGMAFALEAPERVAALVQITPAYMGYGRTGDVDGGVWERMASELESGGVAAFVDVAAPEGAGEGWREITREAVRQRMERHEHPQEVARALREVPRSPAWEGLDALEHVEVPVLVVGSRDQMDPLHPLAIAEEYARRLPNAELLVEDEGKSPLAWQGARLSGAIADFFERVGYAATS
jgi:3-oxoadipate enol-lactonase